MAHVNYVKQTPTNVSVAYAGMPADTELVFVNTATGARTPSQSTALSKGGDGTADIAIDPTLAKGQYYLLAQSHLTKQYIAQTVGFYIN